MYTLEKFARKAMSFSSFSLIVGLLVISCFVRTGVLGIECYRCNSTSLDCLEKFMYPNPLKPESCGDVFEARYCIKTTGIYEGVLGTRRFCSDKDMGNYCDFIKHGDDQREYKGCVYTCNSDGCNGALATRATLFMMAFATIIFTASKLFLST